MASGLCSGAMEAMRTRVYAPPARVSDASDPHQERGFASKPCSHSAFSKKGSILKNLKPFNLRSNVGNKKRTWASKSAKFETVSRMSQTCKKPYTAVLIVPTGIGACIGGYAGDSLPVARAMASVADVLITHPNVLNGAMLYWPMPNVLYVEGYGLDQFAAGNWALELVHRNNIGLVFDCGIEEDLLQRHLQVINASRATLGLKILDYVFTEAPLKIEKWIDPRSHASTGRIGNEQSLLNATRQILTFNGVNSVGVVTRFPDDDLLDIEQYRQGNGVDALSGVEAVISHLIVKEFKIPCAHAPALSPLPLDPSISPRSSAEEIGYTFLPCVLAGLSQAPQFYDLTRNDQTVTQRLCKSNLVFSDDVDCVIVPWDACAGDATISFGKKTHNKPLIIGVEENQTVMNDTPENVGIEVVRAKNYWEAIGIMACHKAGIDPHSLRKDVSNVKELSRILTHA